jgi:endonuclease/exonuclease/phosphatase family metal-dependent hydrolase
VEFIKGQDPDIVGLVEVDAGSYRSKRKNQAQVIAESLSHYHTYQSKYGQKSWARLMPLVSKQGNAFVTRDNTAKEQFHYFDKGMKRLVIELEVNGLAVFLVHLSLGFRVRHHQLSTLYSMVRAVDKPCIVAGDFNALWGEREIELFLAATGLVNANGSGAPSFPSWAPKRHLDFILHSPGIRVKNFSMPDVRLSDHLPLVCDFEVAACRTSRAPGAP